MYHHTQLVTRVSSNSGPHTFATDTLSSKLSPNPGYCYNSLRVYSKYISYMLPRNEFLRDQKTVSVHPIPPLISLGLPFRMGSFFQLHSPTSTGSIVGMLLNFPDDCRNVPAFPSSTVTFFMPLSNLSCPSPDLCSAQTILHHRPLFWGQLQPRVSLIHF